MLQFSSELTHDFDKFVTKMEEKGNKPGVCLTRCLINSLKWNRICFSISDSLSASLSRYCRPPSMYSTNVEHKPSVFGSITSAGLQKINRRLGRYTFKHVINLYRGKKACQQERNYVKILCEDKHL